MKNIFVSIFLINITVLAYSQITVKPFPIDNYGISNGLTEIERMIIEENDFERIKYYIMMFY